MVFMNFAPRFRPRTDFPDTLTFFPPAEKLIHDMYIDLQKYFLPTPTFHLRRFSILFRNLVKMTTFKLTTVCYKGKPLKMTMITDFQFSILTHTSYKINLARSEQPKNVIYYPEKRLQQYSEPSPSFCLERF